VWADALLSAERQYLLRMLAWNGLSIVLGTLLLTILVARRIRSALLTNFAAQAIAWGIVVGIISVIAFRALHLRDVGGAARLERFVWLRVGLDVGVAAVGGTLVLTGRMPPRRLAVIGAGLGVVVQGLALLVLDLQFASLVSR
jgi:hypothetical protein